MSREPEGYRDFVLAETPRLLRHAELLTGERHLAEDLVQDTLARLFTRWARIDLDGSPAGFAHTTLTRLFLSRARKRSWTERRNKLLVQRKQLLHGGAGRQRLLAQRHQ